MDNATRKQFPGDSKGWRYLPVASIRPEEGLGRRRDAAGHAELRESVARFGVLTPITVRPAEDGSGDYLLVKGQGRTLACAMLGIEFIPAVVADEGFTERDKVGQFLVENVARLRLKPVDRALLICKARADGEETADVARRFGITASTVRKLEAQLERATSADLAVLRAGKVSLALHSVAVKHVSPHERSEVLNILGQHSIRSNEAEQVLIALGWSQLSRLSPAFKEARMTLLAWVCARVAVMRGPIRQRLADAALELPEEILSPTLADLRLGS